MVLRRLLDPASYRPALWDLATDKEARDYWLGIFEVQLGSMLALLSGDERARAARAVAAMERFFAGLDPAALAARPHVHAWTALREQLLAEQRCDDPYKAVKERDNELALALLPDVLRALAAQPTPRDRLRQALAGVFAGNRFDLGSPATIGAASPSDGFATLLARQRDSPWLLDHSARLLDLVAGPHPPRAHAVLLVDNAGCDFLLGIIPLAQVLLEHGLRVVLAANARPSLNDVTAPEASALLERIARLDPTLAEHIGDRRLTVCSTGTGTPGIDLSEVSSELDRAVYDATLLILEGQGRAAETNWRTRLSLPVARLLTIKDRMVAGALGGQLFDVVCDVRAPGEGP